MPASLLSRKPHNSIEFMRGIRFSPDPRKSCWLRISRTLMSSFEWNKIIASVLTAMIVAMVTGIIASSIVRPKHLEKPAYLPPGAEAGPEAASAPAGGAAQPAGPEPIEPAMAKADPKHGE